MIQQKINVHNTQIGFKSKSNAELRRMKWLFRLFSQPLLVSLGSKTTIALLKIKFPFVSTLVRSTIFHQFCGGRTLLETEVNVNSLKDFNILSVLDYGAEGKESTEEYNKTMNECLKALEFSSHNDSIPFVSTKITGLCPQELLYKMSAGESLNEKLVEEKSHLYKRIDAICHKAAQVGVYLFIDAEESWLQKAIDDVCETMMIRYNRHQPIVYNTFQMYRKDRLSYLKNSLQLAKEKNFFLGAKLVRGAYMEKEAQRSKALGYENPIHVSKEDTDKDYNLALEFCLENIDTISFCTATHNEASCLFQTQRMQENNIDSNHPNIMFCQLYGMSDTLTFNLADHGFRTGKYIPYGPVEDVIPYLIRRAEENSSVGGEMGRELSFINQELQRRQGRIL
jgi:proline dehydrogenase